MIRSMTGYGGAKGDCAGLTLRVEIRSVNNRYLDCAVRLPRNLLFAEDAVKTKVQEHVSRGKADVFVTLEGTASDDVTVKINEALAREYAAAIGTLGETLGLEYELNALALSRLPDVTTLEKRDLDAEAVSAAIAELTERALAEFDAMRAREGQKLAEDIAARLDTVETLVSAVEQRSPETVTAYRERLYQKMREVLDGAAVDEQRILLEAAIFADKVAVDEETVRLRSHVAQMRSLL